MFWKPDRVIRRILFRLGLISEKEDIEQSIMVGKEFSRRINEPIRYIDIIMVKYGQIKTRIWFDKGWHLSRKKSKMPCLWP